MTTAPQVRLFSAALAVADVLLIRAWLLGTMETGAVLTAHIATLVLLGGGLIAVARTHQTQAAGACLLALMLGPPGGIALVFLGLARTGASPATRAHRAGGAEGSAAERLQAQIEQGRRRPDRSRGQDSFADIFAGTDLRRQQEAIAAISRTFSPEMLPALRLALASEVPALRVQAAAVYAKLRGDIGARAKAVREAASAAGEVSADLAREAEVIAASGFVDAETAADMRAHAARAARDPGAGRPDPRDVPARDPLVPPPRLRRYACSGVA